MPATDKTQISRRAYFGDTDAGGVVHHAAYVHWFEQARTEWIHERGGDLGQWERSGVLFVVAALEVKYIAPVRLDQQVTVTAQVEETTNIQVRFSQEVLCDGQCACKAKVKLVCVNTGTGKPTRIPAALLGQVPKNP